MRAAITYAPGPWLALVRNGHAVLLPPEAGPADAEPRRVDQLPEAAGTDDAVTFAPEIISVSSEGTECTSFQECVDLIKDGEDIDYDGISGLVASLSQLQTGLAAIHRVEEVASLDSEAAQSEPRTTRSGGPLPTVCARVVVPGGRDATARAQPVVSGRTRRARGIPLPASGVCTR